MIYVDQGPAGFFSIKLVNILGFVGREVKNEKITEDTG